MEEMQEQVARLEALIAEMMSKIAELEKRVEACENHEHGPVF